MYVDLILTPLNPIKMSQNCIYGEVVEGAVVFRNIEILNKSMALE